MKVILKSIIIIFLSLVITCKPPTVEVTPLGSPIIEFDYYNADGASFLVLSIELAHGGVGAEYSFDQLHWIDYTEPVTFNLSVSPYDSSFSITARQYDNKGSYSGLTTTHSLNSTPPVITANNFSKNSWYSYTDYISNPKSFTVSGSGNIKYSLDGGDTWNDYTGEVFLSTPGSYEIEVYQLDSFNNRSRPDYASLNILDPSTLSSFDSSYMDDVSYTVWYKGNDITSILNTANDISGNSNNLILYDFPSVSFSSPSDKYIELGLSRYQYSSMLGGVTSNQLLKGIITNDGVRYPILTNRIEYNDLSYNSRGDGDYSAIIRYGILAGVKQDNESNTSIIDSIGTTPKILIYPYPTFIYTVRSYNVANWETDCGIQDYTGTTSTHPDGYKYGNYTLTSNTLSINRSSKELYSLAEYKIGESGTWNELGIPYDKLGSNSSYYMIDIVFPGSGTYELYSRVTNKVGETYERLFGIFTIP